MKNINYKKGKLIMPLEEYYLYAINSNEESFDFNQTLIKLDQIFNSGFILSRRNLGDININRGGWQGLDYISICDYSKKDNESLLEGYTAYNTFIKNYLSIIISKEGINAITPELMPPAIFDWESIQNMKRLGNHSTRRYSDFPDELQVKDRISLNNFEGITLPLSIMINPEHCKKNTNEMIIKFLYEVKSLMLKHNLSKPIYDVDNIIELNNINDIEKAIELINRKKK